MPVPPSIVPETVPVFINVSSPAPSVTSPVMVPVFVIILLFASPVIFAVRTLSFINSAVLLKVMPPVWVCVPVRVVVPPVIDIASKPVIGPPNGAGSKLKDGLTIIELVCTPDGV